VIKPSGWDVAVLVAVAVLCVLVVANGVEGAELVGGLAANAALLIVWFALGRRGADSRSGSAAIALLILLGGVATAITPSMATMQAILFPVLWQLARTTRGAVVTNMLLAVSVGIGYVVGLGPSLAVVLQATVIETISVIGSLAIGFWISRISIESEERRRLIAELHDTQELLAAASRDAGMLTERERLARELHDTIAQDLTGLVLLVQRTRREVVAADPTVGDTLDLLEDSARAALAETRGLVASSAPVGLSDGGIVAALERLGARMERETGIAVTVSIPAGGDACGGSGADAPATALDRDEEIVLLRCAQEGLSNVRRHANATAASVVLSVTDTSATVEVRDDGRGFDASLPRTGFGLDGLTDRLALVGGLLEIDSVPGSGTTLTARLPRHRGVAGAAQKTGDGIGVQA
jgi:signal transduction histidine kinase